MVVPVIDENPSPQPGRLTLRRLGRRLLRATGFFLLFVAWGALFFQFQPFGHRGWPFVGIAVILAVLVAGLIRSARRDAVARAGTGRRFHHWVASRFGWIVFAGLLIGSLGLIAWSEVRPGGPMPPPRADAGAIRVVTWNILVGDEDGPSWRRHGWPVRKDAIRSAIAGTMPDILCVQEALDAQTRWIAGVLPRHRRVGVGRDDGRSGGEHCAIFFDGDRFEELGGGTFWLEEPADAPPIRTLLGPKRICTWIRLRDRRTARSFRVYNLHLYLTDLPQQDAARLILGRIARGDATEPVLVTGDFNAVPDAPCRRLFDEAGLRPCAVVAGVSPGTPTYQFYGIHLRSLDEIFVDRSWRVAARRVLDMKPGNTYPSDHFGVMADLMLAIDPSSAPSAEKVVGKTFSAGDRR
jgi:endonuclease/exonuclease/phosphatase family metal-dependent hydrolase